MKVSDLIDSLKKLPPDADIYLEGPQEDFPALEVQPVTESCEDDTVIGYVLVGSDAHQMELPFNGEKN